MILLYIDPGTGSMLFSLLLGVFTAGFFTFRKIWIKGKTFILGGRAEKTSREKIPVVIFSDSKRYWNTFEPICNELERRGIRSEYWTESEDDPAFSCKFEHVSCRFIGKLNKAITKLNIMNADICLSTTPGLDVYQWKRSKNTGLYVHLFHSVSSGLLYRVFGIDYYDTILLAGDFIEENLKKLEKMRNLPKREYVKAGIPYLDRMKEEVSKRSFEEYDDTTVLLAPTWGINSLLNTLGDELIDALIETGYNIVIRPHPQSLTAEAQLIERLQAKYPGNEKLHWNFDNDNIGALGNSDIMVSDYSGVLYDYITVFDKPVIYSLTEFNRDPYDAWFIEEPPKIISILPEIATKICKEDLPNMKKIIDEALSDTQKTKARAYAREHFWYNHGEGAKCIVDYIEKKLAEV